MKEEWDNYSYIYHRAMWDGIRGISISFCFGVRIPDRRTNRLFYPVTIYFRVTDKLLSVCVFIIFLLNCYYMHRNSITLKLVQPQN